MTSFALVFLVSITIICGITSTNGSVLPIDVHLLDLVNVYKCQFSASPQSYLTRYSHCLEQHAQAHADLMDEEGKLSIYEHNNNAICNDNYGQKFITIGLWNANNTLDATRTLESAIIRNLKKYNYSDPDENATRVISAIMWRDTVSMGCGKAGNYLSCAFSARSDGIMPMMSYKKNFSTQMANISSTASLETCIETLKLVEYSISNDITVIGGSSYNDSNNDNENDNEGSGDGSTPGDIIPTILTIVPTPRDEFVEPVDPFPSDTTTTTTTTTGDQSDETKNEQPIPFKPEGPSDKSSGNGWYTVSIMVIYVVVAVIMRN